MTDARETKFRYYLQHIYNGKWVKLTYSLSDIMTQDQFIPRPHFGLVAVVQFTGMMDSNGNEIYAGDIVTDGDETQGVVRWHRDGYNWYVDDSYTYDNLSEFSIDGLEILGNIYQNPAKMEAKE